MSLNLWILVKFFHLICVLQFGATSWRERCRDWNRTVLRRLGIHPFIVSFVGYEMCNDRSPRYT